MKLKQQDMTDEQVIEGLRNRDCRITREYFYGYCRIAYCIYDRQYALQEKPGLDFYSIAHEYYLVLDRTHFKQLEERKPTMSLKTWMINGFRFVLLDRLKAFEKENRMESLEERIEKSQLDFDLPDDNFGNEVRAMVEDMADRFFQRDSRQALILKMILVEGFKNKEVAQQLGITPSAVTQRFHQMMQQVVIPYFKNHFKAPFEALPVMACTVPDYDEACMDVPSPNGAAMPPCPNRRMRYALIDNYDDMETKDFSQRTTADYITKLAPDEIFVFGSNLAGMHGGGAARIARLHFGAVMGQGVGLQGSSYAIPTMQGGVDTIRPYVDEFIEYACSHPRQRFLVTRIGCGIAGFDAEDIAPLFRPAIEVENISLPEDFWRIIL